MFIIFTFHLPALTHRHIFLQFYILDTRINTVNDFGHVQLEIKGLRESDNGVYECKAVNTLGNAVTTASVQVHAKSSLLLDSQHPQGMKKITALESAKVHKEHTEAVGTFDKPVFTHPLIGTSEVKQGRNAHIECRVVPVGDANMKFEWTKNGESLQTGSRIQASYDFGFVTLDIMQCVPEDSGMYVLKASNLAGESSSSFALHVTDDQGLLLDTMHPESYKKLQELEQYKGKTAKVDEELSPNQPPVFMKQLAEIGLVAEGKSVHLAAQVEPKNDPNLRIEWELNGKVISTGIERPPLYSTLLHYYSTSATSISCSTIHISTRIILEAMLSMLT